MSCTLLRALDCPSVILLTIDPFIQRAETMTTTGTTTITNYEELAQALKDDTKVKVAGELAFMV